MRLRFPPKNRAQDLMAAAAVVGLAERIIMARKMVAEQARKRPPTFLLCGVEDRKARLTNCAAKEIMRTSGVALAATHMPAQFVMRGCGVYPGGMLVVGVYPDGTPLLPEFAHLAHLTVHGAHRVSFALQRAPPVGAAWATQASLLPGRLITLVAVVAWPPTSPYYAYCGVISMVRKLMKHAQHSPYVLLPELCGMPWTDPGCKEAVFGALADGGGTQRDALETDKSAWCAQGALSELKIYST